MKENRECDECGEQIPAPRFRLIKDREHRTCIQCQEALEASGRFQRHMMNTTIRFKGDEVESEEYSLARGST